MLELTDDSICFPKLNIDFEKKVFSKEDIVNIISSYQIDGENLRVGFIDNGVPSMNVKCVVDTHNNQIEYSNEIKCGYEGIIKELENAKIDTNLKNAMILYLFYHEFRHLKQLCMLNDESDLSMYDYLLRCSFFEIAYIPLKKYINFHRKMLLEFDAYAFSLKVMNKYLENYVSDKTIMQFNQFASNDLYQGYKGKIFKVYKSPIERVSDFSNNITDRKKIKLAVESCCDYGLDKGGKITYSEYKELRDIAEGKVKTKNLFKHLGY